MSKEENGPPRYHCMPLSSQVNEVILAAYICAAVVVFVCYFISKESLDKKIYCGADDVETDETRCFKYVGWPLQITRLICATLFHVKFESKVHSSIKLLKFAAIEKKAFRSPLIAYSLALCQLGTTVFIEWMQILNLVMLFNIQDIIENFVSLMIINDFGDHVLKIFKRNRMSIFMETKLNRETYADAKATVRYVAKSAPADKPMPDAKEDKPIEG